MIVPLLFATHRVVGVGSAVGLGFGAVTLTSQTVATSASSVTTAVLPHTIEGQIFVNRRDWSIDLTIPLTNVIVVSGIVGGFFFQMDSFFAFNFGRGVVHGFIGPGLGFTAVSAKGFGGASLRVPAEGGIEFVVLKNHLAIRALARPWIEFAGGSAQTVGGGIVGLVGVTGYFTREDT
jgi:hypothetical protein